MRKLLFVILLFLNLGGLIFCATRDNISNSSSKIENVGQSTNRFSNVYVSSITSKNGQGIYYDTNNDGTTDITFNTDGSISSMGGTMTSNLTVSSLKVNTTSYFAGNIGIGAAPGSFPLQIVSTEDQLNIKYDVGGSRQVTLGHSGMLASFASVNNDLIIQSSGGNPGYGGITFNSDGTQRMYLSKDGAFKVLNNQIIGASANFVDYMNAKLVASQGDTNASSLSNIGVVGEAKSNGVDTAFGILGVGQTNGSINSYGLMGIAKVTASSETASAVGVCGVSTMTHSGNSNISVYADAQNGATNYSFYGENGNIYNNGNITTNYGISASTAVIAKANITSLTVTGTSTLTGLVNGRNISADGTSLDAVIISTGALELSKVNRTGDTMTGHLIVPSLQVNTTSYFAGNVGIGAPLQIVSTRDDEDQLNIRYDAGGSRQVTVGHSGMRASFASVNNNLILQSSGGNPGYGGISLETDGTRRMYIDKAGNIGMGTSNVNYKLEVQGQTRLVSDKIGDPATDWGSSQPALTTRLVGGATVTAVLDIGVRNNNSWWIQSTLSDVVGFGMPLLLNPTGGNVGINTLTPTTSLDVNGAVGLESKANLDYDDVNYEIDVSTNVNVSGTISANTTKFAVNLDTTTAPSSTGIVGLTSGFKMYVSTGTSAGSWLLIGSQS